MKTKPQAEKSHKKYSSSASWRWLACAGSVALSEKAPPQKGNAYSEEGTLAHECVEYLLKKQSLRAASYLRKKYPAEMVDHAVEAYREIESRLMNAGKDAELLCETKASLDFIHDDAGGTLDAAIVQHFGRLTVIDYKYGMRLVEPENNSQLICYALSIAEKYDFNFEDVALVIIQPRAPHDRGTVREWVMSIDELQDWHKKIERGIQEAEKPNAPLKSGTHCKYCPASVICPEISTKALKQAQIVFDQAEPETISFPLALKPEALGRALQAFDRIEHWIDESRKLAFSLLQGGTQVPGWKLVEKRSIRRWNDASKVEKDAKKKFGASAFTTDLLSPAQLEKVAGKDWVNDRCSAVSSGQTLAPEEDSRPSYNKADVFSDITSKPTKTKTKGK